MMRVFKFTSWQDGQFYIGFLNDYPDYMTQGFSKEELVEKLKSLLEDLETGGNTIKTEHEVNMNGQPLHVDDVLLAQARHLTGLQSDCELIELALQELIARRRHHNLLDLAGRIDFVEDFDHKNVRTLRNDID